MLKITEAATAVENLRYQTAAKLDFNSCAPYPSTHHTPSYDHDKHGSPAVNAMNRPLNIRQQRFAEFLVSGEKATHAYIRAGYKVTEKVARTNAARMLANAHVKAYIAKLRAPDTVRAFLTKDEKREMIAKLVRKKLTVSDLVKLLAEDSRLAGHYEAKRIEVETGPITLDTIKEIASRVRGQSPLPPIMSVLPHYRPQQRNGVKCAPYTRASTLSIKSSKAHASVKP